MTILFLSHYFYPHIGGVEKHVYEIGKSLVRKKHKVIVVTEKFDDALINHETVGGINVFRFRYPKIKLFGILSIWVWLFKNRELIKKADIVHCHDVFIWYLPFRFLNPNKKVFVTIHGLEWARPVTLSGILQKRLAVKLADGSVGVGKFLEKYIKVKFGKIIYGAYSKPKNNVAAGSKEKNNVVFLGRLEKDTGILKFIKDIKNHKQWKVHFVGDGSLKNECLKYGRVYGFTDPTPFLKVAEYAVPGGYLSYIEALTYGCKIKLYPADRLKEDYWEGIKKEKSFLTWSQLADEYIRMYNNTE